MSISTVVVRSFAVTPLLLALMACASAAPESHGSSLALPMSASGRVLAARVSARPTTAHSVNVVVHLIARSTVPVVQVRVDSLDRQLAITPGCMFEPLEPPQVARSRRPPYPLPAVPLCSVVVHASQGGRYALEVRILDRVGHDLVAPIHAVVEIPYRAPSG